MDQEEKLSQETETLGRQGSNLAIPGAIVLAGALIAVAVIYTGQKPPAGDGPVKQLAAVGAVGQIRAVTRDDHIRGNPDAEVKIIEYSDFECPFCKRFHPTMQQAMNEYGGSGKVAWVYRHLPLDQLHSRARKEAEASECAAKLGGNDKFWEYADRIFEVTPSNNQLNPDLLPEFARDVGLDQKAFEECLAKGEFASHVDADIKDAESAGAEGTPFSLVIDKNGKRYPINGAQPYNVVKDAIEKALAAK